MNSTSINFKIEKSNHIIIECKLNKIKGRFIIDTGASNSCVNKSLAKKFNISFKKSKEKASSATNQINEIYYSKNNLLNIANYTNNSFEIILFDMAQINESLREKEIENVDGIIGGEILYEFNAIIDYKKKLLTLEF